MLRYETIRRSAGLKKWVSATAVADLGDSQALWRPPQVPFALGIAVGSATLHNRSGGVAQVALAGRFPSSLWAAGQVTAAGVYTADTTDAQSSTASDFSLHTRTDSGSGILIASALPFNIIGIIVGTTGDQTSPTLVVEYWNGTDWIDITASLLIADVPNTGIAPFECVICFPMPSDWAVGGTGTGVPATTYNLRIRQTTSGAGTANPVASQVIIGHAAMQVEGLVNNGSAVLERGHEYPFPPQCDALFPVFSTAHRGNTVEVDVRAY